MANGNPFYVNPLGGQGAAIGQGLAGLGSVLGQQREAEQQALQRQQAQQAVQEAVASGDPQAVAKVMIQYPEYQKIASDAFGFTNEQTQGIAEQTYAQVLANPENAQEILQQGIQQVRDAGGRPLQMTADLQRFMEDPGSALKAVELGVASVAPKVHEAYTAQQKRLAEQRQQAAEGKRFETKQDLEAEKLQLRRDELKLKRDIEQRKAAGDGQLSQSDKFDLGAKIRKEIGDNTKDFVKVRDAYARINAAEDTPAGQMSLVFNYMKMLDPTSTVREGEYASARNTTGIPGQVINAYNQAVDGKGLKPKQVKDFKSQSKKLFTAQKKSAKRVYDQRISIAKDNGLTERDVYGGVDFFDASLDQAEGNIDADNQVQQIGNYQVRAR